MSIDKIKAEEVARAEHIMLAAFAKAFPIVKTDKILENRNYKIMFQAQLQMAAEAIAVRAAMNKRQPLKDSIQQEMEKLIALVMHSMKGAAQKGKENGKANNQENPNS